MLFSQEVMPRYRVEDPTKQTSELMKLIGKEWNEMDPERKAVYSSKAAGLRENYHKEMSAYKASQTSEASASSEGTEKPNEKSVSLQVVPDAESHSAEKKKKKRKHRERDTDHENSGEGEVVKKKKVCYAFLRYLSLFLTLAISLLYSIKNQSIMMIEGRLSVVLH